MTIIKCAVNHHRRSTGHYKRRPKQAPKLTRGQARCPGGNTFQFTSKDNSEVVKAKRKEDSSKQRWSGLLIFSFSHETSSAKLLGHKWNTEQCIQSGTWGSVIKKRIEPSTKCHSLPVT